MGAVKKKMPNGIKKEVGIRIREIRGALNQKEFSEILGINQATVCKYESGRIPEALTLKRIAEHGGVTIEWLLHGDKTTELHELPESITIESPPPGAGPGLHDPYLFGRMDIGAMTQIIEMVQELQRPRKKPLKPVRFALLVSLLYDHFQTTGRIPGRDTLKEFLRRVD